MKNLILLVLFLTTAVFGQTTRRIEGHIPVGISAKKNYIKNSQLEQNDNDIVDADGIASHSTGTPLDGLGSLVIDSTATSQKVCFSTFTREPGIYGQNCKATVRYNGDASTYTLSIEQGGTPLGSAVAMTNAGTSAATAILPDFDCGVAATGANAICINSTADGAAIKVDDVHLELSETTTANPSGGGAYTGLTEEVFNADDTWDVPTGIVVIYYEGCGGGGGGGGAGGTDSTTNNSGGGGGAAATYYFGWQVVIPGDTLTIDIGDGGPGGAGGNDNGSAGIEGTDGGNTTVSGTGVSITLPGGDGGNGGTYGGGGSVAAGGTGGSNTDNATPTAGATSAVYSRFGGAGGGGAGTSASAGAGGSSLYFSAGTSGGAGRAGGGGGASYLGAGGNGGNPGTNNAVAAAANTCAGGGGGAGRNVTNVGHFAGAAGGSGKLFIRY